jgi:hypothetical protein
MLGARQELFACKQADKSDAAFWFTSLPDCQTTPTSLDLLAAAGLPVAAHSLSLTGFEMFIAH